VKVELGDAPVKGAANAPITILEFSDFQCPFCSRVLPTLKQVEEKYGSQIKVAFRNLPLVQIHPDASRAAEAGACAADQGKFWEMHDKMFSNQQGLSVDGLKKMATEAGLDAEKFASCLGSGDKAARWHADTADAERYGVSSTPAFFINGRLVSGARPFEDFARIIEDELARAGVKPVADARTTK
jgi:protein-disulfide isomerase